MSDIATMGASLQHHNQGQSQGRRLNRRRQNHQAMSEINVTPFVDVMLVLLIIFMVTAPMITVGIPVDLPKTKAGQLSERGEPVNLTMTAEGDIYLQDTKISLDTIVDKLKAIETANQETQIFIRGDKELPYGKIMGLMGVLNQNGFNKVALLAESPKPKPKNALRSPQKPKR